MHSMTHYFCLLTLRVLNIFQVVSSFFFSKYSMSSVGVTFISDVLYSDMLGHDPRSSFVNTTTFSGSQSYSRSTRSRSPFFTPILSSSFFAFLTANSICFPPRSTRFRVVDMRFKEFAASWPASDNMSDESLSDFNCNPPMHEHEASGVKPNRRIAEAASAKTSC